MMPIRRILAAFALAALVVAIAGLAYWAGTNAVTPPALAAESHPPITYAVKLGTVGSSVRISVAASWATTRVLHAGRSGVVTSVSRASGGEISAGAVVATIDLQPVVVAAGSVPMFRTLQEGADGPDVAQLQQLMKSLGMFQGPTDGRFAASTTAAVKLWQSSLGTSRTGVVDQGSLLFVESLPAKMEIEPRVGDRIEPGGDLAKVLAARPSFVATVPGSQRAQLRSSEAISIAAPGGSNWSGTLGEFQPLDDGRYTTTVGGTVCGDGCSEVPVDGETALTGTVELVPQTTGPVVPTSAMVQQPSGELAVTLDDGTTRAVTVVAEADGFAVVKGIEPGTAIRLPSPPSP